MCYLNKLKKYSGDDKCTFLYQGNELAQLVLKGQTVELIFVSCISLSGHLHYIIND